MGKRVGGQGRAQAKAKAGYLAGGGCGGRGCRGGRVKGGVKGGWVKRGWVEPRSLTSLGLTGFIVQLQCRLHGITARIPHLMILQPVQSTECQS